MTDHLFKIKRWVLASAPFFICCAILLASRPLYVAIDDENYLNYFRGLNVVLVRHWYQYIFSEPLWSSYAKILGVISGPDFALRITLFTSVILFLYSASKLSKGSWGFIIIFFLISNQMATQMYFNQIRQGFALSLFLLLMVLAVPGVLSAIIAATVHSSFLLVVPCVVASKYSQKNSLYLIFSLIGIIVSAILIKNFSEFVYIGRRTTEYAFSGTLDYKYYISNCAQLILIFWFMRGSDHSSREEFWFIFSLIFSVASLAATFVFSAGARFMYLDHAFIAVMIGRKIPGPRSIMAAVVFLFVPVIFQVHKSLSGVDYDHSWLGRWSVLIHYWM